jgi:hypothetical protein
VEVTIINNLKPTVKVGVGEKTITIVDIFDFNVFQSIFGEHIVTSEGLITDYGIILT